MLVLLGVVVGFICGWKVLNVIAYLKLLLKTYDDTVKTICKK